MLATDAIGMARKLMLASRRSGNVFLWALPAKVVLATGAVRITGNRGAGKVSCGRATGELT